jgi:hypothetical protein
MEVINWNLVRHPLNWVTLFLMVFIAVVAVRVIAGHPGKQEKE